MCVVTSVVGLQCESETTGTPGQQIGEVEGVVRPFISIFAVSQTGIPPAGTAVIEDSYNGIRAAHAAGMMPIMVPDMLPPDEEMRSLAVHILPDLDAVRFLLCPEKEA